MNIHLASFPRSGNKYAQQLLHVLGNKCRTVYPVPSDIDEIAPTWDGKETGVFLKTHELRTEEQAGIYLVRNPLDVYCSYARYITHLTGKHTTPHELMLNTSWSSHVLSWDVPGVYLLRYETLLTNPSAIQKTCESLGMSSATVNSMPDWNSLHTNCPWYYQQGRANRWKEELTLKEVQLCVARNRDTMTRFGYYPH